LLAVVQREISPGAAVGFGWEDHITTTPHDINRFRIAALSLDDYAAGRVYMAGLAHDAGQSANDLFDALYVSGMRIHREKARALCLKLRSVLARHFVHLMPPIVFPTLAQFRLSAEPSGVQIFSGHHNAAGRVTLPQQLRESETFDLGPVPYKDSDQLGVASVLSAHALPVQEGSLRYPALFEFAAVLHNEMDIIAARNNHDNGPQTG
jgi:hypothetical protein